VILTTAPDVLLVLVVMFAAGTAASHLLFRKSPMARAIARVGFLILLTIALLYAGIVPYKPLQSTGVPWHDAAQAVLKIAWWLWMAWFLVGFLRAFVIVEHRPREGKLLQDLLAGLIYLAALFAIVSYVFDLPLQGLLATSGVIAIILGLALQSSLGDVFSGIVLSLSRPYRPGDWISIEGGTDGRVIELNWRATHVLTARRDLAIVPNSTITKSKIVNVSSPSGVHGNTVTLQVGSRTPPSFATEVIERALLNCRLILPAPAPVIATKTINGVYAEFEITFFTATLASSRQAQNEWLDLVYRHLAAAAIDLASPASASTVVLGAARPAQTQAERVVDWMEMFAPLTPAERGAIASKLQRKTYHKGERLLEPGMLPQSLFVVGAGVLSFLRQNGGVDVEVLRLGPGDHFGEIGVLTDQPSTATIVALTPVTLYELAKVDLGRIVEARPEVAHELAGAMARRQAAGLTVGPAELDDGVPPHRLTSWFTTRLQRLYDISNAA
jgi:small-conductance mechanosensitive channel